MSADNAGGERFLCVNPLCTVPPHSALWSQPPGPTRNTRKNILKLFVFAVKRIRHGSRAVQRRGNDGTRTMCRNAKMITTMAKPRFSATRNTLLEVLVWKRVRRSQQSRQDVGLFQGMNEVLYKQLKKKIPGISARSRGYPDSCNSSKLEYGPQLTCLPASTPTSALTQQRSWARTTQPGHSAAATDMP